MQGVADAYLPLDLRVGEGGHDIPYLYGQPELEPVQGVADAYLSLDLCVGEGGHDIPYLYRSRMAIFRLALADRSD